MSETTQTPPAVTRALNLLFKTYELKPEERTQADAIGQRCRNVMERIMQDVPPGPWQERALSHLQDCFYAVTHAYGLASEFPQDGGIVE